MKRLKDLITGTGDKLNPDDYKPTEATEEIDDTGLTDFRLSEFDTLKVGVKYTVTESDNDDFEAFDEVVIKEKLNDALLISKGGKSAKKYKRSALKTVEAMSMGELDAMFDED